MLPFGDRNVEFEPDSGSSEIGFKPIDLNSAGSFANRGMEFENNRRSILLGRILRGVLFLLCLLAGADVSLGQERTDEALAAEAMEIVGRQTAVFTKPPQGVPSRKMIDGPLLGNGDLGVTVSGSSGHVFDRENPHAPGSVELVTVKPGPDLQRYWLSKNDFWKTKAIYPNAHPAPIGYLDISTPALANGEYLSEQALDTAELRSRFTTTERMTDPPPFTRAGATLQIRSWVAATRNLLVIELSSPLDQGDSFGVDLKLAPITGNESETATGNLPGGAWATRKFASTTESLALEQAPLKWDSLAAVAMRVLHHGQPRLPVGGNGWSADRVIVSPENPVTIVLAIVTQEEAADPLAEAKQQVAELNLADLEPLRDAHRQWWRAFWSRSYLELGEPKIEQYYYGSQYILGCASRNPDYPPGLWANWITADGVAWGGDYHLNYNHEVPWLAAYSSNRVELTDPYDAPLLAYMDVGRANARRLLGIEGIYYDVGIGPKGLETVLTPPDVVIPGEGNRLILGQKSHAAFAASNMIMRFRHTYDLDYARKVYPYLSEVALFWEQFLKLESGRYVIRGDSLGETGGNNGDTNNNLALGMVRNLFAGLIEISRELNLDPDRREKWELILAKLSPFPLAEVDGVWRVQSAEAGPSASRIGPTRFNTRVDMHGLVWPATNVGLSSESRLLKALQQDAADWPETEWILHFGGFNTTFPAAARLGHDPKDLLAKLRRQLDVAGLPNLFVLGGGGGFENVSGVPATINEMLLQSHAGVIRLFAVWPREKNARFVRLRTVGAFLVSAELRDQQVSPVTIESERGRNCILDNPWPGQAVSLQRGDGAVERLTGDTLRFGTRPGERLRLTPQ